MNPVIVQASMNTPYGLGRSACWKGLLAGTSAIRATDRFSNRQFISDKAALVPDLGSSQRSRALNILAPVLAEMRPATPPDAALLLATVTGEVDLLERSVTNGSPQAEASHPRRLLAATRELTGVVGPGAVISSACISSCAAVAQAADMIRTGRAEAVLVVACDAVSEFVFAGFSTLMALSSQPAMPFDRDRDGLTLGEAAAAALIMNPDRAKRENRPVLAEVLGWGLSADANHMTGPSRDGAGLARAIELALKVAKLPPDQVQSVNAHGTATVYNDAMEIKALRLIFGDHAIPVYAIKGGTGHTTGAAGLLEILIAAESLHAGVVPPTVGTQEPDEDAAGWITLQPTEISNARIALSINSGFGGVNGAVVLGKGS